MWLWVIAVALASDLLTCGSGKVRSCGRKLMDLHHASAGAEAYFYSDTISGGKEGSALTAAYTALAVQSVQ